MAVSRPTKPRMQDVAAKAGVSLKTVSRVVNDEPNVDERTRARVQEAIHQLGFRRNEIARGLRSGVSTHTIGLIIEDIANPFFSAIARGVEEVALRRHYMVIIGSNEKDPQSEQLLVESMARRQVDGLLVVPASHDHAYIEREMQNGVQVVFLDRPPEHLKADVIVLDNRGGARRGVDFLLKQGHTAIAFLGGDPHVYTGAERLIGYKEALAVRGIPINEAYIKMGRHNDLQAEAAMHELLELPQPPTAVFADNNRMTVGVIKAMQRAHTSLAIVGFDDIELADVFAFSITLVVHDPIEMGRQGARVLLDRLNGDTRAPQRLVLPSHLVMRGSGS